MTTNNPTDSLLMLSPPTWQIFAAGIDVWYRYNTSIDDDIPTPSRFDFESLDNVVMSPHRGGAPDEKVCE